MIVTVDPASEAERPIIDALFQFYIYDFSEFEPADSPRFGFDPCGRFAPYSDMDSYWREPDRRPWLIRVDGQLAGFALINTQSDCGATIDWAMAQFFVARKLRRRGVAIGAARTLFQAHTGVWEVAVTERNVAAQRFWPAAIRASGASAVTLRQGDGRTWAGPIWTFVSGAA